MDYTISFSILCLSSFFTLLNPAAATPMFAALTQDSSIKERRAMAGRVALTTVVTLCLMVLLGDVIFSFFHITVHGFRVVGGILFFGMGLDMLRAKESTFKVHPTDLDAAQAKANFAITPLAIPVICGPGSIANAMILSDDAPDLLHTGILLASIVLVSLSVYLILVSADGLLKKLGPVGLNLSTRLMGLIVMVIAVEFVVAGLRPILIDILRQAAA